MEWHTKICNIFYACAEKMAANLVLTKLQVDTTKNTSYYA